MHFFFNCFYDLLRSLSSLTILFVKQGKELRTGWGVGTRPGCCQIEWVAIICILIFHICKKIAKKKKIKKKK